MVRIRCLPATADGIKGSRIITLMAVRMLLARVVVPNEFLKPILFLLSLSWTFDGGSCASGLLLSWAGCLIFGSPRHGDGHTCAIYDLAISSVES